MLDRVAAERFPEPVQAASSYIHSFSEGAKLLAHIGLTTVSSYTSQSILLSGNHFVSSWEVFTVSSAPESQKSWFHDSSFRFAFASSWAFRTVLKFFALRMMQLVLALTNFISIHFIPKYSIHCLVTKSMSPPWCPSLSFSSTLYFPPSHFRSDNVLWRGDLGTAPQVCAFAK